MRRYSNGHISYAPDDLVAVNVDGILVRAKILSLPEIGPSGDTYRISIAGEIRQIPAQAIVKEADTGGIGFISHDEEGRHEVVEGEDAIKVLATATERLAAEQEQRAKLIFSATPEPFKHTDVMRDMGFRKEGGSK